MTAINCSYLCTINNTDDHTFDPSILKPPFDDYVLQVFRVVAVICIFGYFGNVLLILSTWRKGSALTSKSHQLIAHLAIADIITCTAHMQVRKFWQFLYIHHLQTYLSAEMQWYSWRQSTCAKYLFVGFASICTVTAFLFVIGLDRVFAM